MERTTIIDFEHPDETRTFEHGRIDIAHHGSSAIARMSLLPGWRWETDMRPMAGTKTCQLRHLGSVLSGHMQVTMEDGTKVDLRKGDTYVVEPGHLAEVVGKEPFEALEFSPVAAESFAQPQAMHR